MTDPTRPTFTAEYEQFYTDWEFKHEPLRQLLIRADAQARTLAAIRAWLDEPIGSEADVSLALQHGLGMASYDAEIAAVAAVKAINDCRDEIRAILDAPDRETKA